MTSINGGYWADLLAAVQKGKATYMPYVTI
jgi:hypothetical protein